jgi:hypothetical protein
MCCCLITAKLTSSSRRAWVGADIFLFSVLVTAACWHRDAPRAARHACDAIETNVSW